MIEETSEDTREDLPQRPLLKVSPQSRKGGWGTAKSRGNGGTAGLLSPWQLLHHRPAADGLNLEPVKPAKCVVRERISKQASICVRAHTHTHRK